ncbi:MAG: dTMP kinase [Nitrospirae bacterium]|nr:MAG: dTMP kinase [Nitrospirota bacterium]
MLQATLEDCNPFVEIFNDLDYHIPVVSTYSGPKRPGRAKPKRSGLFITFEGIEGSGKTSQCHHLATTLREHGYWVIETREPGGTPWAEQIRTLLLSPQNQLPSPEPLTPETETCLILASRSHHVTHLVTPALARGAIVLCDRFSDSTLAYQGYGRGLDLTRLRQMNRWVTHGLTPHLTFLFDLPVRQGLARRRTAAQQNRLDREPLAFHQRVRRGFRALAMHHRRRIVSIDARSTFEAIAQQIFHTVSPLLEGLTQHPPSFESPDR